MNRILIDFVSTLFLSLIVWGCSFGKDVVVTGLEAEFQKEPQALGITDPVLGWKLESKLPDVYQKSYRILAASSPDLLLGGKADLWDSHTVNSGESIGHNYEGVALDSRSKVYWKVIVETNVGVFESNTASFGMALLHQEDWKADWIGCNSNDDVLDKHTRVNARYLRKDFEISGKVAEAKLYICGLGSYDLYINGKNIGDAVLKPAPSDYRKTCYYNTYDVTGELKNGKNAVGVVLGGGRFVSMRINPVEKVPTSSILHFGMPCLLFQLEINYKDGTESVVISNTDWKATADGPIRKNNEFDGETYDAFKEMSGWSEAGFDDSLWQKAVVVDAPGGVLTAQPNPYIRVQDTLTPISITQNGNGYIVDMGQNMVGWLKINISGQEKGDTITMRFAEILSENGSLYMDNLRGAEVTDRYIAKDSSPVSWTPRFVYHGFRYVEIKGLRNRPSIKDFEGQVFYDEMPLTGNFETSNEIINKVYRNAYWGIRGNYRGMPTDCPQRDEKMGWTGDRTTGCYGEAYIFSNELLYAKWLRDIAEAQNEAGSLPDVAPTFWEKVYSDNMTWPGVFITASDMIFTRYAYDRPIKDNYMAMKKWLNYMKSKYMVGGIMTKDTYGDWCIPPELPELIHSKDPSRITDGALISTAFYYRFMKTMAKFAIVAKHAEDVEYFKEEAEKTQTAFNNKYLNKKHGYYSNNTVTANILPLYFGMVPAEYVEKVFSNIADKTRNDLNGHVSVGVIGIQQLLRCLTEYGQADLAFKIASESTYPSWGYMAEKGATTIWELWNGDTADPSMNSGNHVMLLGDLITWEYECLGGIRAAKPGFKEIILKPYPVEGLDWVKCSYDSVYGKIISSWKKSGKSFVWNITIPANTSARVFVPGVPDASIGKIPGVETFDFTKDGYREYEFPSGSYILESSLEE